MTKATCKTENSVGCFLTVSEGESVTLMVGRVVAGGARWPAERCSSCLHLFHKQEAENETGSG